MTDQPVLYTDDIGIALAAHCRRESISSIVSVCDANTYAVAGRKINGFLSDAGINVRSIILSGVDLVSDSDAVMSVFADMDIDAEMMLSVGSGTITDIVRFASHRGRKRFISVATAPSVDGYSSTGAPVVIHGFKQTFRCHAPELIITSPDLLGKAPGPMIAAGVGDVLGKVTAVADWRLAHLLVDAPYDPAVAETTLRAYTLMVGHIDEIAARTTKGLEALFSALVSTGNAIRRFGSSAPASGSEHHISHLIEMMHIRQHRSQALHGAKVALGTCIAAGWYKVLRRMAKETVKSLPIGELDIDHDARELRTILGPAGDRTLDQNSFLSTLTHSRAEIIRARLVERWDEVQEIAISVPDPEELRRLIGIVGGPARPGDLGLTAEEVETAARLSLFVRNRFTIRTLLFVLGLYPLSSIPAPVR